MAIHSRTVAALIAALAFGAALAGTSAARSIRLANGESGFRFTWSQVQFIAGGSTVRCALTLEGSFSARTFAKTVGGVIGRVTRATLNTCSGGSATVLRETLPWTLQYAAFGGTLPRITSITTHLIGASVSVQPTGSLACLARASELHLWPILIAIGLFLLLAEPVFEEGAEIPLTGEGGLCAFAGAGHVGGTGAATILGGTAQTTVELI